KHTLHSRLNFLFSPFESDEFDRFAASAISAFFTRFSYSALLIRTCPGDFWIEAAVWHRELLIEVMLALKLVVEGRMLLLVPFAVMLALKLVVEGRMLLLVPWAVMLAYA